MFSVWTKLMVLFRIVKEEIFWSFPNFFKKMTLTVEASRFAIFPNRDGWAIKHKRICWSFQNILKTILPT